MRHLIVHYHIFKNAGVTIDSILKKNFGVAAYGTIEGAKLRDTLDAQDILKYAIDNPGLKVISSHQARLPEPKMANLTVRPIVFLRHPIDRVGSVYSFERRQPVTTKYKNIAHQEDLGGYVRRTLDGGNGPIITNFQTIHLSGRERDMGTAVANQLDLERALQRIEGLGFFGIVELFQDSVLRMKHYLAKEFGTIDTTFSIENRSEDRKATIEERVEEIRVALGPNLYGELLHRNSLDLELYKQARLSFINSRKAYEPSLSA